MAVIHSDEFKRDAVRIALTSGLTRRQTIDPAQSILPSAVWDQPLFVSTQSIMTAWQTYERSGRSQYQPRQERELHEALRRLCPSATRQRKTTSHGQQRGYDLPAFTVARAEFTAFLGGEVTWDD